MSRIGFNHSRRFESAQSKVLTLLKLIVSALIPGEKKGGGGKGCQGKGREREEGDGRGEGNGMDV